MIKPLTHKGWSFKMEENVFHPFTNDLKLIVCTKDDKKVLCYGETLTRKDCTRIYNNLLWCRG